MTQHKMATLKFTAYKDFDCPQDDDLLDRLKSFCEDNEIEYEDSEILDLRDECPMCGKFKKDIQCVETETGESIEGCQHCIDNWEPETDDRDDLQDR